MLNTDPTDPIKVGARITRAIDESGIPAAEIARQVGVSSQAINGWKKTGKIEKNNLTALARITGFRSEWILTGNPPERVEQPGRAIRYLPIISSIQAGKPKEAIEAYLQGGGFETVPVNDYPECSTELSSYAFALRVEGDSMSPEIPEGSTVIIDPEQSVRPGDVVAAKIQREDAVTLKRFRDRGLDPNGLPLFELVPTNPNYPVISVSAHNPGKIIGPVVEIRIRPRSFMRRK